MKKVARGFLLLIVVGVLSGLIGYIVFNSKTTPVYSSTTKLYVVPGQDAENSLRTASGSLNDDFALIFKSDLVITDAQKTAGTTEDLASYISIHPVDKSNIIEITCENPDQNTAKKYVDAVAMSALKTTSIIPVEKISILSEGTTSDTTYKPNLIRNTLRTGLIGAVVCLIAEFFATIILCAFRTKEVDDEADYNFYYGNRNQLGNQPVATPVRQTSGNGFERKDSVYKKHFNDKKKKEELEAQKADQEAAAHKEGKEVDSKTSNNTLRQSETESEEDILEDVLSDDDILASIDDADDILKNDTDDVEMAAEQNIEEHPEEIEGSVPVDIDVVNAVYDESVSQDETDAEGDDVNVDAALQTDSMRNDAENQVMTQEKSSAEILGRIPE